MIESIENEGTQIVIKINTGVVAEGNILVLKWEAKDEIFAELLKRQLWNELNNFKSKIVHAEATNPGYYLTDIEISSLKEKLHKWDSSKHCWKEKKDKL